MVGVLLINLGTPEAPDPTSVRKYLGEFLMDPQVIDIPFVARWLLVNGIILQTRPKKSSAAYRQIWTQRGSPLMFHTEDLTSALQGMLKQVTVKFAMRYGQPSIATALEAFHRAGIQKVLAAPLYPQFSLAATQSSLDELKKANRWGLKIQTVPEFHSHPGFIKAFAMNVEVESRSFEPDHYLFSFHGLPERQIRKVSQCEIAEQCCERYTESNQKCYRAQCFQTAHDIARELKLERNRYSVGFQSRLGGTPWIKPYTDHLLESLPTQGVRKLLVVSPSFVADCLETLEEITIRGKNQFIAAGGSDLRLVPSLNANPHWVAGLSELIGSQLARSFHPELQNA